MGKELLVSAEEFRGLYFSVTVCSRLCGNGKNLEKAAVAGAEKGESRKGLTSAV